VIFEWLLGARTQNESGTSPDWQQRFTQRLWHLKLKSKPYSGFKAQPNCSLKGIVLRFTSTRHPRTQSGLITSFSLDKNELVACQIKGIARLIKGLSVFQVGIKDNHVELTTLFWACRTFAEEPGPIETYEKLAAEARNQSLAPTKGPCRRLAATAQLRRRVMPKRQGHRGAQFIPFPLRPRQLRPGARNSFRDSGLI